MARNKLTEAGTSKLADRLAPQAAAPSPAAADTPAPARLSTAKPYAKQPKSFRLGGSDIDRLRRLAERLSKVADRPFTDTEIVRGVLLLGERADDKKLVDAIKDAMFEAG